MSLLTVTVSISSCRQQDEDLLQKLHSSETLDQKNSQFSRTIETKNVVNSSNMDLEGVDAPPKNGNQWKQSK